MDRHRGKQIQLRISVNNGHLSQNSYIELDSSEIAPASSKINFSKSIVTEFFFEINQKLRIEVLADNYPFSTVEGSLASIVGNSSQKRDFPLESGENLVIYAKQYKSEGSGMLFQFNSSLDIDTNDEYFYVINTKNDSQEWRKYFKSTEMKGKEVNFPVTTFSFEDFTGENHSCELSIEVFNTNFTKIGYYIGNLKDMNGNRVNLISDSYKGTFRLEYKTKEAANINTYLSQGLDVSLAIAIDYTMSNGYKEDPGSLHYFNNELQSPYEQAIQACGSILAYYDSDQSYPVFGFGASYGNPPSTSFSFPVSMNHSSPFISGIDKVIEAYRNSFNFVQLSGPTNFRFFLKEIFSNVRQTIQDNPKVYFMVMVLTDGAISDLAETKKCIADNVDLPVSIVIVGVGTADFYSMDELDGDDSRLRNSRGEECQRDIVQFVPFEKYKFDMNVLAGELLKEVPSQIEEYFINFSSVFG